MVVVFVSVVEAGVDIASFLSLSGVSAAGSLGVAVGAVVVVVVAVAVGVLLSRTGWGGPDWDSFMTAEGEGVRSINGRGSCCCCLD